jgi:DNA polymerase-3 subunit beta
MKLLQANRDDLLKPLQAVTGIVEKRHTLPILSNVLLEQRKNILQLVATDLEIQVTADFSAGSDAKVAQPITVSARKLHDILRSLPDGADVTLEAQPNRVQVRAGKSRFNLQTLPADDFPKVAPATEGAVEFSMPQGALRSLLLLVHYAMAQQDIRYYLNGMLLVLEDGMLRAVSTDGHRLAMASRALDGVKKRQEAILPRKAVVELVKLLGDGDEPVKVQLAPNQARFAFGNIELVTKVVDGKFPDYQRVIPSGYQKSFTIQRPVLQQALQRVAILSNEKFRGVRWMLTANSLKISCTNTEQEEASEEIEIDYQGDALDIGFNVNYLLDVLTNVQREQVTCGFGDANSSVLISMPDLPEFRYVVMPMRI